jgi:iron(III) transport system ATP-binding protein
MATVTLQHISKNFHGIRAVHDVSMDIASGEFFSILGPSGCGKTTLLRMIAGLERPSEGRILLDGKDITSTPPQERSIGMVFQNYALFPHMTVFENVAYGLETRKLGKQEIRNRVGSVLATVNLAGKAHAAVPTLSGGEQQRVAVARALVIEPAVLLFDEPLSNLDVALRLKTRQEIRLLQRKTHITTIYVTHDQSEAMSLSDRIAVMQSGVIEQVGTPVEMYESPSSLFVARFLGGANVIRARSDNSNLHIGGTILPLPAELRNGTPGPLELAIKPEAITVSRESSPLRGTLIENEYLGFTSTLLIEVDGMRLQVAALSTEEVKGIQPGEQVGVHVHWRQCRVFPVGS